ncbi:ribokinase [uncultured Kocuria sp.]|uniref:ribokinase n=1 Tax=uncultured Kocuria sp. TaxID=259305 RepID=UPI002598FA39|nr:ribokinase [uncultured Kocuria sp.]MCT1367103.1 ribokinase [Rothia sp. p3-SID1597]
MVKPQVFVVGSVSRDVTVTVDRFPAPGETLVGESVTYGLGGKGANQAVASALTGTPTAFLGCVGDDDAGHRLLEELRAYGVATDAMSTVPGDSGTAHITVDAHGENTIAIVPAANRSVSPELVRRAGSEGFGGSRVVVAQGEIPVETLEQLARTVSETSARFILNLAPASDVSAECLSSTDVLVVNESEAQAVIRRHSLPDRGSPAATLTELAPAAVVTLGSEGSAIATRQAPQPQHIEATRAEKVVDTTGAGDAYVGVFAALVAKLTDAVEPENALPLDVLARCARIASREAARVVGAAGASSSYTNFSVEE